MTAYISSLFCFVCLIGRKLRDVKKQHESMKAGSIEKGVPTTPSAFLT
jgi:hypothetical protein